MSGNGKQWRNEDEDQTEEEERLGREKILIFVQLLPENVSRSAPKNC